MKAPGGCENLKAQAVGRCKARPIHAAAPGGEDAEGAETSREALLVGVWCRSGVGFLENQRLKGSGSVLGQPLKRSRSPREEPGSHLLIPRGLEGENPGAQPERVKGMRGAPKQCGR
jgi:hypothetical protein